jgi:hypothetical protein
MMHMNDGAPTDLYLVRIWRGKSGDGTPRVHGKLQHAVSGESSYFDGLSSLPGALEKMMAEKAGLLGLGSDMEGPASDGPD